MGSLVDAKIAAAEARTDAKFAQLLGKLDLMDANNRGIRDELRTIREDSRSTRSTVWTVGFGIAGLIGALAALAATLGPSAFSAGVGLREIAREEVRATQTVEPSPAAAMTERDQGNPKK